MPALPPPPSLAHGATRDDAVAWVAEHLGDLTREGADGVRHGGHDGGQRAADTALATLDISGYSRRRSTVLPVGQRGASRLSPYVRHGLLTLTDVWDAVADAPATDRRRFRDELLWQEYARHLYARVGERSGSPLRYGPPQVRRPWTDPWPREMRCMDEVVGELERDGWVVNQTRMWLASQWVVRAGADWRAGEDELFAHLLDGSRAANRLGWQWTVGIGSGKPYGFSRWQVRRRAPQLCDECALSSACPIDGWPDAVRGPSFDGPDLGPGPTRAGPSEVDVSGAGAVDGAVAGAGNGAEEVWLTAESLGAEDPALTADPARPAVFVFDEPLLSRLRLSGKRLVFLAETLGGLAATRPVEVRRGRVSEELAGRSLAVTYAPVPGFQTRAGRLRPVEVHPWPWLVRPTSAPLRSYSAWRKGVHR